MGWGSATQIFDQMVDAVIEYLPMDTDTRLDILEKIAKPFWIEDWDTEMESKYFDAYLLPIMRRRDMLDDDFDEWYEPR